MATEKETLFIKRLVETGKVKQSAIDAGFSVHSAESKGSHLKRKFANEIQQGVTKRISGCAPEMLNIIMELARNSDNDQVRIKAATDIMSRAGHDAVNRTEDISKEPTRDEAFKALASQVGKDKANELIELLKSKPTPAKQTAPSSKALN